jgi:hypothetical protein
MSFRFSLASALTTLALALPNMVWAQGIVVHSGEVFRPTEADTVTAIVPIDAVDFMPFADGLNWIVKQPLVYRVGVSHDSVVVPVGFVTDFASIPPELQSIIQQSGPYQLPALVHDWLYWSQSCTRWQADGILLLAMIEHKVQPEQQYAIYGGVVAFGWVAWNANAREKAQHQVRVIPRNRLHFPALTHWSEYRAKLSKDTVADGPSLPVAKAFCRRGTMTIKAALEKP